MKPSLLILFSVLSAGIPYSVGAALPSIQSLDNLSSGQIFLNIHGEDDREELKVLSEFPYSTLVNLNGCSGAFVGPDLILTAAHCVVKDRASGIPGVAATVYPVNEVKYGYKDGRWLKKSQVTQVYLGATIPDQGDTRVNDWAVMRIKDKVTHYLGFDIRQFGANDPRVKDLMLLALHQDKGNGEIPHLQKRCSVISTWPGSNYLHDCDMMPVASGAPLIRKAGRDYLVVGVNTASLPLSTGPDDHRYTDPERLPNIAASASQFGRTLLHLREHGDPDAN